MDIAWYRHSGSRQNSPREITAAENNAEGRQKQTEQNSRKRQASINGRSRRLVPPG
jgi:hypothetical protein